MLMDSRFPLSDFDLGWLIGILDGEGCFGLSRDGSKYLIPSVKLSNTNYEIISKYCRILRKLKINWNQWGTQETCIRKPSIGVGVFSSKNVKIFLDIILPHMECRFIQANYLYEFVKLRLSKDIYNAPYGEEEWCYYKLLKEENKRGPK